jgi:tetratricopeptide (TPR) repeat protein
MPAVANDTLWLVKSGDRIIGPFTTDEVTEHLSSRTIVLIDEIMQPLGRWRYVREEPIFANIIEEIRKGTNLQKEDTEVGLAAAAAGFTDRNTDPGTITDPDVFGQTLTPTVFNEIPVIPTLPDPTDSISKQPIAVRSYGLGDERTAQANAKPSFVWLWVMCFIAVAVATFTWTRHSRVASHSGQEFGDLVAQGVAAERVGDQTRALRLLQAAAALKPHDLDVKIQLGPLLIKQEGQMVEARRLINEVLATTQIEDHRKRGYTALALAGLLEDDYPEAGKNLEEVKRLDSSYLPALFNTAVLHFLTKDIGQAEIEFEKIWQENPTEAAAAAMMARTQLMHPLGKISAPIQEYFKAHEDFRQEEFILQAYSDVLAHNSDATLRDVRAALNADPYLTDEFVHPVLYDLKPLSWTSLALIVDDIAKASPDTLSETKALQALAMVKIGRKDEALRYASDALKLKRTDSLLQAIQSYVLRVSGHDEEAMGALHLALDKSPAPLAEVLNARVCMQNKDSACAMEQWRKILKRDPQSVAALTGLADLNLQSGEKAHAQDFMSHAKDISPVYAPLLNLADSMTGTGDK